MAQQETTGAGIGRQKGALRPDWGLGWAELECTDCAATWTGPIGEQCAYCIRAVELMAAQQAELLLRPPDMDPADERYPAAVVAWGQRLARAVRAGIITKRRAEGAYSREAHRAA